MGSEQNMTITQEQRDQWRIHAEDSVNFGVGSPRAGDVEARHVLALLDELRQVEDDRNAQVATKVAIGEDLTAANDVIDSLRERVGIEVRDREQWESNAERADDAIQRVRDLHTPYEWSFGEGPVTSCRACADVAAEDDDALYPCPTIRALDGTGDEA
jgi:hypothetical protein